MLNEGLMNDPVQVASSFRSSRRIRSVQSDIASMPNMKRIFFPAIVLMLAVSLTGCFEDMVARKTYDGPLQVEFAQYHQPFAPATTNANWVSTVTFPHDAAAGATASLPLLLQLIGPQQSSPVEIGYRVAENRLNRDGDVVASTTAQEGTHYRLVTGGGAVTFPANSSSATLEVEALAANLQPGQSVRLVLELTEMGNLIPANNYRYYDIIIRKAAPPAE
jgi:hypothetical protein